MGKVTRNMPVLRKSAKALPLLPFWTEIHALELPNPFPLECNSPMQPGYSKRSCFQPGFSMEFWSLCLEQDTWFFPPSCQLMGNKWSFTCACPKGKPETSPARLHWSCLPQEVLPGSIITLLPPETCGLQKAITAEAVATDRQPHCYHHCGAVVARTCLNNLMNLLPKSKKSRNYSNNNTAYSNRRLSEV